jgi:hypothetical protein
MVVGFSTTCAISAYQLEIATKAISPPSYRKNKTTKIK